MIPLFPTTCLLLSLLFILTLHHRKLRSLFAPKPASYTHLLPNHHLPIHSDDNINNNINTNTSPAELPLSPNPATPLSKYFNPDTGLLYGCVMEPPSPRVPLLQEEEGEEGWVDVVVERVVGWVLVRVV
ncbi:hypothetical protein BO71DRAFT_403435 [Aspergillus ellipticus CBS 707.79]|uniref:Uncharacterized protein n=1 Tax=Aspergillus ellipticus CBS 707.79 TaxID=1448320 RepID=A0A319CWU1_9EURO|nr:hypothetical protein BO71DRAFT_403435 [Aspergillus ellipticus CBS 707.79]